MEINCGRLHFSISITLSLCNPTLFEICCFLRFNDGQWGPAKRRKGAANTYTKLLHAIINAALVLVDVGPGVAG